MSLVRVDSPAALLCRRSEEKIHFSRHACLLFLLPFFHCVPANDANDNDDNDDNIAAPSLQPKSSERGGSGKADPVRSLCYSSCVALASSLLGCLCLCWRTLFLSSGPPSKFSPSA